MPTDQQLVNADAPGQRCEQGGPARRAAMTEQGRAVDTRPTAGGSSHGDGHHGDHAEEGEEVGGSGANGAATFAKPNDSDSEVEPLAIRRQLSETQITSHPELANTHEEYPDTQCGLGSWQPAWLQRLASKKVFVLLHGLIGFHQIAMGSYIVGTISTIEKRFKIPSKTTGIISAAWDAGSCCSLLLMGYLGRQGHKPRYVAMGTFLLSIAFFGRLLPHLLYGPGQDALELTKEYGHAAAIQNGNSSGDGPSGRGTLCGGGGSRDEEDCSDGGSLGPPAIIFIVSSLFLGFASSVYWSIGVAYLDDNTHKDKAPLVLAATSCIRLLGPTVGFSVASYALARYVDLDVTPLIGQDDPRWIGAWWIGYGPGVAVGLVLAALMLLFPRQLPRAAERRAEHAIHSAANAPPPQHQRSLKDFASAMRRILRNKLLVFNSFSGVCFVFGWIAYWIFMPKYMETQFRQSASQASLISGSVGLVFSGLGIASSAIVISKFKPRARVLAAWSVCVEVVDVVGHFSWAFLSCGEPDLHGSAGDDGAWNLTAACNAACSCGPDVKYEPVCALGSGSTFYSPCHAGCGGAQALVNGTSMFSGCACSPDGLVVEGPCPRECAFNFGLFLATQCLMSLLGSSGKAGNTLIQFRCIREDDKPLAIAFGEFLVCALAFIPGPIVFGSLLDAACLVWGKMCGQTGNCWVYDDKKLRYYLNFTGAGCMFCGMLLDIIVWYLCKDLQIYEEEVDKEQRKPKESDEVETPFLKT